MAPGLLGAAGLCGSGCSCHLPRHQHFCRFCFRSRDGAAAGRARPTSSTRCSLGTQDHGQGGSGLPPPRGQDTQPSLRLPWGHPAGTQTSKHVETVSPVAPQLLLRGQRRSPQPLSRPPAVPRLSLSPSLAPRRASKTFSQGQGERHSCLHPHRCHHTRCPQREYTHAMGLMKPRQCLLSLGTLLIIETVSLPPPCDSLTHTPALAAWSWHRHVPNPVASPGPSHILAPTSTTSPCAKWGAAPAPSLWSRIQPGSPWKGAVGSARGHQDITMLSPAVTAGRGGWHEEPSPTMLP